MKFNLQIPAGLAPHMLADGRRAFSGGAVAAARGGSSPAVETEVDDAEPIELVWDDGTTVVLLAERARTQAQNRGPGPVTIPSLGGQDRGGLVAQIVHVAIGAVAGVMAKALAVAIDERQSGGRGFVRLTSDGTVIPIGADLPASGAAPLLLLLHGTISNTAGGFSDLLASPEWPGLHRSFEGRAYGFDHRTFSDSPLENAARIMAGLPEGARVYLVSHSRGGLVADVLAAACAGHLNKDFTSDQPELSSLMQAFTGLVKGATERKVRVLSTIRVAAPAVGTTLASARLDHWLNVLLNVIGLTPSLAASPLYKAVKELLLRVVAERLDTAVMPGIAAMVPDGPFIRWLNALWAEDDLYVAAGDTGSSRLLEKLKGVLIDLYFQNDNDLVVDTAAMVGGAARTHPVADGYRLWEGGEQATVDHFKYFGIPEVRRWVVRSLAERRGVTPLGASGRTRGGDLRGQPNAWARTNRRDTESRNQPESTSPCVIVVPGFMGTQLGSADAPIWPSVAALARGGLASLPAVGSPVECQGWDGLVGLYSGLANAFDGAFEVRPFPYDWRQPLKDSTAALAALLHSLGARQVHLLTHGAGGLVARGLHAWHPDLWQSMTQRGGRLVMVAPPNRGVWSAARFLAGTHPLVDLLSRADLAGTRSGVVGSAWGWPGLLALLPLATTEDTATAALFAPEWWARWGETSALRPPTWADPTDVLRAARSERARLDAAVDPDHMMVVVGRAGATPLDDTTTAGMLHTGATEAGDGEVTWASSSLPGVPMVRMDRPHAELLTAPAWRSVWLDLIRGGSAAGLPRIKVSPPRGVADSLAAQPRLHPTDARLIAEAFGGSPVESTAGLEVTIVHGDPALETGVVLVGHFAGSWLRGVEQGIDIVLKGALSTRLRMGTYPQAVGDFAVIPRSGCGASEGIAVDLAVVAGLGVPDGLTRARIAEAVEGAIIHMGLYFGDTPCPESAPERGDLAGLSIAPPGVGLRGLPVEDVVAGTLDALALANRRRRAERIPPIAAVRLVFSFGDQASEAVRAAVAWSRNPGTALLDSESIAVTPIVMPQADASWDPPRRPFSIRDLARIGRLEARATTLGHQAGVTYGGQGVGASGWGEPHAICWPDVARLSCAVTRGPRLDVRGLQALRDHLLPPGLDGAFQRGPDLLLVVDAKTAAVPWEAFIVAGASCVLTGRTALLRQLIRTESPRFAATVQSRRALVVRSPDPVGDEWPALRGVEPEARAVASTLSNAGFEVAETAGGLDQVLSELTRPVQILHLVGHGRWAPQVPDGTGFVTNDGQVLKRGSLGSLLRAPPALVFLNACDLGRLDGDRAAYAADLAGFLISTVGVQVVIAAGWSVNDTAALAFARTLYERLCDGAPLRLAVASARVAAAAAAPGDATWAAYQCYGDPDFVLSAVSDARATLDEDLQLHIEEGVFVTSAEVADLVSQVHGRLLIERASGEDPPRREGVKRGAARLRSPTVERYLRVLLTRWRGLPETLRGAEAERRLWRLIEYADAHALAKELNLPPPAHAPKGATRPPKGAATGKKAMPPYEGPESTLALRQKLSKRLNVPCAVSTVPRGPAAEAIYRVEEEISRILGSAASGGPPPKDWGLVPGLVRAALTRGNTDAVRRDLSLWLHLLVRHFRHTLGEQDAGHDLGTSLVRALRSDGAEFWDDPNLDAFGGLAHQGQFRVTATITHPSGHWYRVTPELTLGDGFSGVVIYDLHPSYRVRERVWGYTNGTIEPGGEDYGWWASGAYTLGVSIFSGDLTKLRYAGPPWTPLKGLPSVRLELDLAECPGADTAFNLH